MQKVFGEVKSLEKYASEKFCLTEDLMIENAALSLEQAIRDYFASAARRLAACETVHRLAARAATFAPKIFIMCGSGNNGADGYALARRLAGEFDVAVIAILEPKSPECIKLSNAARAAGAQIITKLNAELIADATIIVDCIYGTGFRGTLSDELAEFLVDVNVLASYKIACDIPSGIDKQGRAATICDGEPLAFCADVTVSMGGYKIALFSDAAKCFTGKIVCGKIGVSEKLLTENFETPFMFLEKSDMKLPVRTNAREKSAHKGTYGHATFLMGEKFGAATIAAKAALNFGAGLVSVVAVRQPHGNMHGDSQDDAYNEMRKAAHSDIRKAAHEFLPELMYVDELPENMTAVCIGSGLGRGKIFSDAAECACAKIRDTVAAQAQKSCGVVFDADIFYHPEFDKLLSDTLSAAISSAPSSRGQVVLTPHPKEFQSILRICMNRDLSVAEIVENRFELAQEFSRKFPECVLVLKGAYTLIAQNGNVRICGEGTSALAKGGSGDVLAGMICATLAQGYSAIDAATTCVLAHGIASQKFDGSYALTPMKLIDAVANLPHTASNN